MPTEGTERLALRAATIEDADAVTDVDPRSRKELVACAPLAHSDTDVRDWIRLRLLPAGRTMVAVADGLVIGMLAALRAARTAAGSTSSTCLPEPGSTRGIGSRLLDLALRELPAPVRLYTFQCNERARRFYERRGFEVIAFGDGSGNEERCPDILYEWRPGR